MNFYSNEKIRNHCSYAKVFNYQDNTVTKDLGHKNRFTLC